MKRIEIIAGEKTYSNLATFENIEELNETIRTYKKQFAGTLTKTEITILELLHRYSAKYKGVSFMRKGKIAEIIGKSRRTVIRVCQRLEALGIIRQYELARPTDKRQTSNAIVIQPIEASEISNVTPEPTENVTPRKQNLSLKQNHYIYNTYYSKPYKKFKETVNYFTGDQQLTNKLYGIYLAQTSALKYSYDTDNLLEIGIHAIIATFNATKRKKINNKTGYYHGTLNLMLDKLYYETLDELSV